MFVEKRKKVGGYFLCSLPVGAGRGHRSLRLRLGGDLGGTQEASGQSGLLRRITDAKPHGKKPTIFSEREILKLQGKPLKGLPSLLFA